MLPQITEIFCWIAEFLPPLDAINLIRTCENLYNNCACVRIHAFMKLHPILMVRLNIGGLFPRNTLIFLNCMNYYSKKYHIQLTKIHGEKEVKTNLRGINVLRKYTSFLTNISCVKTMAVSILFRRHITVNEPHNGAIMLYDANSIHLFGEDNCNIIYSRNTILVPRTTAANVIVTINVFVENFHALVSISLKNKDDTYSRTSTVNVPISGPPHIAWHHLALGSYEIIRVDTDE